MCLGSMVVGCMGSDLLESHLPVVQEDGPGWSHGNSHIDWDIEYVAPSVGHCLVSKSGQKDIEVVWLQGERFLGKQFDACPPQLDPIWGCIVDGSLVHKCWD